MLEREGRSLGYKYTRIEYLGTHGVYTSGFGARVCFYDFLFWVGFECTCWYLRVLGSGMMNALLRASLIDLVAEQSVQNEVSKRT